MAHYWYRVKDPYGKVCERETEAESEWILRRRISEQGYRILKLRRTDVQKPSLFRALFGCFLPFK